MSEQMKTDQPAFLGSRPSFLCCGDRKLGQNRDVFFKGMLYREFLREFGVGEVKTSWLIGILIGLVQLSGE